MGKVKTFKKYLKGDIDAALEEIRLDAKILPVSHKYRISRTTLRRRYVSQEKADFVASYYHGSGRVLTSEQEEILIQWMLDQKKREFAVCRARLVDSVKVILVIAFAYT